jgi:predicted DNA-binding WGR domain protein
MTEKELWEEFNHRLRYDFKPQDRPALKGYVNGENELPQNIEGEDARMPSEIGEELGGKHDELAFKMLQAIATGMAPKAIVCSWGGVRVLKSFGFTLPQVYAAEAGNYGQHGVGKKAFQYFREEAEPFVDLYLDTFRQAYLQVPQLKSGEAKHHNPDQADAGFTLYGFVVMMIMGFLKEDLVKFQKYVKPLEEFISRVCDDTFNDVKWQDWFTQREHQEAAWDACGMGFGDFSPTLRKLERRILLSNTYLSELKHSKEELLAWGKTLDLPEEWAEVLAIANGYPASDGLSPYEHFKKLFKENRPLFDKTLRSFYWKFDGKTSVDDDVVKTPSYGIRDAAFVLLSIMFDNGEGAAEKEELTKHWKAITKGIKAFDEEKLSELSDDGVVGTLMLYKHNIPPIDDLFAKNYASCRYGKEPKAFITATRHDLQKHLHCVAKLCPGEEFDRIARPLIEKKVVCVEEIFIAPEAVRPWYTVPMDVVREVAAAYPEEAKAFIEKANKGEYEIEIYTAWIEAVFGPGGLDPTVALGVLNAKSKRALNSLSTVLLSYEQEVRTPLELMLPKLKKDASAMVQQLFAQWNARPGAKERAAQREAQLPVQAIAPAPAPAAALPVAATSTSRRSFVYTDDKSNKFWDIEVKGKSFTVTFGKVGSSGQSSDKTFDTEALCDKEVAKLIAEKTKKGYKEQAAIAVQNAPIPAAQPTPIVVASAPSPVAQSPIAPDVSAPATAEDTAKYADTNAICGRKLDKNRQKLTAWIPTDTFEAVVFADGKTPAPNVFRLIVAEHLFIEIPVPLAECAELFRLLDKKSAGAALESIYQLWLNTGADAKKKAVLIPYCQYCSDSTLIAMKAQVYHWISASRGAIAAFAVECLAGNGGDIALLAVDELCAKAGHKQVQKAARQSLLRAANAAGITLDELQDRIVPNLGFDADGSRLFDYGSRQFQAVLQKDFSLSITDSSTGKVVKSLPAPNAKDDAEKASAAKAELSGFRKTLKEVVRSQSRRLSRVLINGRPWKPAAWQKLFVENPLMNRFASGLIWGEYDASGNLLKTFRYMEDGSFNTAEDSPYSLSENALISLAHPLELGDELAVWKQQLADYEITQPIKQLDLTIAPLKDEDIDFDKNFGIKHYKGIVVPEGVLTSMAKSYDMQRGPTGDGGSYYAYSFQDTWLGLCAVITFEGPYFGGGEPGELQYAYFYKLPGIDDEDPVGYGDIAKGAGLDPRTLPPRFTGSLLSIFDKLAERAEKDDDE